MRTYFSRPEQYAAVLLLLALLGGLFTLAFAVGRRQRESTQDAPFLQQPAVPPASAAAPPPAIAPVPSPPPEVVVHITGAVRHSGVYHLHAGARVDDALHQAGGALPEGYPDALNLAAKLEDGMRVYVPTKAEWKRATAGQDSLPPLAVVGAVDPLQAPAPATPVEKGARATADTGKSGKKAGAATAGTAKTTGTDTRRAPKQLPKEKINLNTATVDKLAASLPGVGQVTAQRIVAYRTQHGKFTTPAEILNIPGIGEKTFKKIEPYVTL